jgi:predicted amidophosphoribosyltransferase
VRFLDAPDALLNVSTPMDRILGPMHPGYCPQCGERVTPYAAGCALCGADLDPKRWQKPLSVRQRLSIRTPAGLRHAIRGRAAVWVRGSL